MKKQSDSTSFDLAEFKEFKQFQAMKALAEANKAEAKVEPPKKRGRPTNKATTTTRKISSESTFLMLKGNKWGSTGGKGSAHFAQRKAEGKVMLCINPDGRVTVWNWKAGVSLPSF